MTTSRPNEIRAKASARAFGDQVIQNDFRSIVAETTVESALGPDWRSRSGDWLGWDFEHRDQTRLQVKQSAVRQTWTAPKPGSRGGYYVGSEWHPKSGRHADIYVFAYHAVADASADQLDLKQWVFYVVSAERRPPSKTIGLARITGLASATTWEGLFAAAGQVRLEIGRPCEFSRDGGQSAS